MTNPSINLRDLIFLIADPSSYMSMLIHSMLRGFGSNKILEVRNSTGLLQTLTGQKIDILICDTHLQPHGGLQLTRAIRGKKDNEHRTVPILIMSDDSRESTVKRARDAGANMVIAKARGRDRLGELNRNPRFALGYQQVRQVQFVDR
jgi:two-component system, chemotaxis family, chemotaxis protein CheY